MIACLGDRRADGRLKKKMERTIIAKDCNSEQAISFAQVWLTPLIVCQAYRQAFVVRLSSAMVVMELEAVSGSGVVTFEQKIRVHIGQI